MNKEMSENSMVYSSMPKTTTPSYSKVTSYKRKSLKIGRNAQCPCGSTKKYKKCCGV